MAMPVSCRANPRMGQMYRVWDGMAEGHREAVLGRLDRGEIV
jgi:hypothetical protein